MPTLTISHDTFVSAARMHAKLLGLPDVPLLVEPAPKDSVSEVRLQGLLQDPALAEQVLTALTDAPLGADRPSTNETGR